MESEIMQSHKSVNSKTILIYCSNLNPNASKITSSHLIKLDGDQQIFTDFRWPFHLQQILSA